MHFDIQILFEDTQAFPGVSFPVTFRAKVEVESLTAWLVHGIELPSDGADGGWVELRPQHPLFSTLKGIALLRRDIIAEEARQAWVKAEQNREMDEADRLRRECAEVLHLQAAE